MSNEPQIGTLADSVNEVTTAIVQHLLDTDWCIMLCKLKPTKRWSSRMCTLAKHPFCISFSTIYIWVVLTISALSPPEPDQCIKICILCNDRMLLLPPLKNLWEADPFNPKRKSTWLFPPVVHFWIFWELVLLCHFPYFWNFFGFWCSKLDPALIIATKWSSKASPSLWYCSRKSIVAPCDCSYDFMSVDEAPIVHSLSPSLDNWK